MGRYIPVLTFDGEYVDAEELGNERVNAYNTVKGSEGFQSKWAVDPTYGDLYPLGAPGEDSGIGTIAKPARHIAIGDPTSDGMEGAILARSFTNFGGINLIALRDVDPQGPLPEPLDGNAPLELNGSSILITGGTLYLQVPAALDADHELLIGPSITAPDGRFLSPLIVGPEKVYQFQEEATDARNLDVLGVGEVSVVSLTTTNTYGPDISTFSFDILLENTSTRITAFDIIIYLDSVEAIRYQRDVTGGQIPVSDSLTLQATLNAGSVIEMRVEAVGTHPQSLGRVRGDLQPSKLRVQQG